MAKNLKDQPMPEKVEVKKSKFYLTVRNPFNDYKKGDRISDYEEIQLVIESGNLHHCNKTEE